MATKNRQCPISWPTRRLLMAEIENTDGLDDGANPATLQTCLESVQSGYEPYANFPTDFVKEEIKLLQKQFGKEYDPDELLSDRDWDARQVCNASTAGDPPLEIQVDYDLARFITVTADHNGIDTERYVNNLLEKAVLEEGGTGPMILQRSQVIGEYHVDAGATVVASTFYGTVGHADRFFKRQVEAIVNVEGKPVKVTGVVSLADLAKPEDVAGDYETLERRVQAATEPVKGLIFSIERLTSGTSEADAQPANMVRVQCQSAPAAKKVKKALHDAGLTAYTVRHQPAVLHVRQ